MEELDQYNIDAFAASGNPLNILQSTHSVQALATKTNGDTVLSFNFNSDLTVRNAEGKYLSCKDGEISGNMAVNNVRTTGYGTKGAYQLEVSPSESFTCTIEDDDTTSFMVFQNDEYWVATVDAQQASVTVTPGTGIEVNSDDTIDYQIVSALTSDQTKMIGVEGTASGIVKAGYTESGQLKMEADNIENSKVSVVTDSGNRTAKLGSTVREM